MSDTASRALSLAAKTLLSALILLAMASCAKRPSLKPPSEALEPYEGPVTIEALKNSSVFRRTRTLKSEVKVRVYRYGDRMGSYSGVLLYEQPSYVRLRLYGAFGSTEVDMVHSDGLLQIYLPDKKHLYEGETPRPGKLGHTFEDAGGSYVLYAHSQHDGGLEPVAIYTYDRRTLLNTGITVYRNGEVFLGMRFGNFSGALPYFATLDLMNGYTMEMELKGPVVGSEISPEFFERFGHEGREVLPLRLIIGEGR